MKPGVPELDDPKGKKPAAQQLQPQVGLKVEKKYPEELTDEEKDRQDMMGPGQKKHNLLKRYKKIFNKTFREEDWDLEKDGNNLVYKDKKNPARTVNVAVDPEDNFVTFSGAPDMIAQAAKDYQKKYHDVVYVVEASSLEAAKKFMLELKANGFDIAQIKEISCKDNPKVDVQAVIAELNAGPGGAKMEAKPVGKPKQKMD